ncbi:MAG: carbohydrate ABC transporter permease [Ruthenibacterium lactatiformans]
MKSLGLYNNPWVWSFCATSMTNIIISRTFFETNIPNELREAAEIDGCSNTRFFFSIVLPLSTAIIAVMALFFAVTHWNGYFTAMIYVRDKDWQPLQIVMREILMRSEFNAQMLQQGGDTGVLAAQEQRIAEQIKYALIVVASVPVMCIYPFVQKHFVKGVTVGAVKG